MSHRTLLAVAAAPGYDCHERSRRPRASAPHLRRIDDPPDWHAPDRRSVFEGVDPTRHETLVLVPVAGPLERYCTLPLDLSAFLARPDDEWRPDRALLVAVRSDAEATEFRRLWDGARAVAAVLADTVPASGDAHAPPGLSDADPESLLARALDRLTHDRTVIHQRHGPQPPP